MAVWSLIGWPWMQIYIYVNIYMYSFNNAIQTQCNSKWLIYDVKHVQWKELKQTLMLRVPANWPGRMDIQSASELLPLDTGTEWLDIIVIGGGNLIHNSHSLFKRYLLSTACEAKLLKRILWSDETKIEHCCHVWWKKKKNLTTYNGK